jgi:alpha/beta superfamily hydrolase
VVCHAHPLYGGTLHTRTVFHLARALVEMNMPVLRFNFRGVGRSAGTFDGGAGETDDLNAALGYVGRRFSLSTVLGGFSFGAAIALRALTSDQPQVERFIGVGLPANSAVGTLLPAALKWNGAKLFISGSRDQYGSVEAVTRYFDSLREPKRLIWVPEADHFLSGRMDEFRALVQQNLFLD